MRLDNIEIRNYKSCEKTSIEFERPLTALIGINGSGKTSILSAIRLLKKLSLERNGFRSHSIEGLFETVLLATFSAGVATITLKATVNYDIGNQSEEEIAGIKTEWRIPRLAPRKWFEIPIDLLNQMAFNSFDNAIKRRRIFGNSSYEKFISLRNQIPNDVFEELFQIVEYMSSISYYSATQFSDPQKCPTSIELEERDSSTAYRPFRRFGSHTAFIHDLVNMKRQYADKYERYLNMIGPLGIGLVDDIGFEEVEFSSEEVNVKSGGKILTEKRKKLIIVPKIFLGTKVLSFNQLSEGTFKTAALLFYAIEKSNSLLLIEEPEVCVHHGLLKSVLEVIKSESEFKQIVISTHSDYVLDQLEPENLVLVTRSNEVGTVAKPLSKSLSKNSYLALHAYLESTGNLGEFWKEGGFDE